MNRADSRGNSSGRRAAVEPAQPPSLHALASVEALSQPRELLNGWHLPNANSIIYEVMDTCQWQYSILGVNYPIYHSSFSVSSVGWQNGRILGELEVNALHGKALQLEKYSAKGGVGIGRMAEYFLKCRAKPGQIFKYCCAFAAKRSFREWVPKLSLGTRKKSNGRSRWDNWLFCVAQEPYGCRMVAVRRCRCMHA
jgi:hypothetical protein